LTTIAEFLTFSRLDIYWVLEHAWKICICGQLLQSMIFFNLVYVIEIIGCKTFMNHLGKLQSAIANCEWYYRAVKPTRQFSVS